jgi:hypothetical protein
VKVTNFTKCCLRLVVSPGLDESLMVIWMILNESPTWQYRWELKDG